jgi:hypothetical protein
MCDCLRWAVTFLGYFNQRLSNALMMTKNRLGYRLGEFFTNSSGRHNGNLSRDNSLRNNLPRDKSPFSNLSRDISLHGKIAVF